jgi:hypothetical protein
VGLWSAFYTVTAYNSDDATSKERTFVHKYQQDHTVADISGEADVVHIKCCAVERISITTLDFMEAAPVGRRNFSNKVKGIPSVNCER